MYFAKKLKYLLPSHITGITKRNALAVPKPFCLKGKKQSGPVKP